MVRCSSRSRSRNVGESQARGHWECRGLGKSQAWVCLGRERHKCRGDMGQLEIWQSFCHLK